jgi:hypothetical protein
MLRGMDKYISYALVDYLMSAANIGSTKLEIVGAWAGGYLVQTRGVHFDFGQIDQK